MTKKYKIALIGAGKFGKKHFDTIIRHSGLELIAICDKEIEKAKRLASTSDHKLQFFDDYTKLLQISELEIIVIVTPPEKTTFISLDALKSGKHIFLEKPISLNLETADALLQVFEERSKIDKNLTAMVDYIYRGEDGFDKFVGLIQNGLIGVPHSFKFLKMNEINSDPEFEKEFISNYLSKGFGPNFMAGGHYLFVLWMIKNGRLPIQYVSGFGSKYLTSYPVSNDDVNILEFRDKSNALLNISWLSKGSGRKDAYYHLVVASGDEGSIIYYPEKEIILFDSPEGMTTINVPKQNRLKKMYDFLIRKIEQEEVRYFPSLSTGKSILEICLIMNGVINTQHNIYQFPSNQK